MSRGEPVQPGIPGHVITVPAAGGEPPYCVVGGNGFDRLLLAEHIAEIQGDHERLAGIRRALRTIREGGAR